MTCTPADDAFLTTAWPGVVTRSGERWLVVVDPNNVQTGTYTVTMAGLPFQCGATVPPDTAVTVQQALLQQFGLQMFAAASPQGLTGILLQEIPPPPPAQPGGLSVTVTGPAADTITATLISGGDANEAQRLFWLNAVLCSMPDCRTVCFCGDDYRLMHAALAAHWIYSTKPQNVGATGAGANDFDRMRLGPGELVRGNNWWALGGNSSDGDLARTVPGQYFLSLRRKYIFPIVCA